VVLDGVEEEPDELEELEELEEEDEAVAGVDGADAGVEAGADEPEPGSFAPLPERESVR
jgi:hypothetical protein